MKDDVLTPNELLAQALRGDREALGQVLEAWRTTLHRSADRQLGVRIAVRVDASDVIQQAFLEAYRSFPQFGGHDVRELGAWLEGILDHKVANAIRDHALLQKRDVRRELSIDDSQGGGEPAKERLDAGVSSPSQKAIRGEDVQHLSRALTALPDDQREAVRLRHIEGWALADIARRLDRTPAATAGLIKRGMQALRRQLHHDNGDPRGASQSEVTHLSDF
jgi:RNA polymerase sigma-70 factor, ECF subfamily